VISIIADDGIRDAIKDGPEKMTVCLIGTPNPTRFDVLLFVGGMLTFRSNKTKSKAKFN
jgi:hypothetical protein